MSSPRVDYVFKVDSVKDTSNHRVDYVLCLYVALECVSNLHSWNENKYTPYKTILVIRGGNI